MKKALFVLTLFIFSFILFGASGGSNVSAQTCSKDGQSCQSTADCRPFNELTCSSYSCLPDRANPGSPFGVCGKTPQATPSPPPAPFCSKSGADCMHTSDCQPAGETGCGAYTCGQDPCNPQKPVGMCIAAGAKCGNPGGAVLCSSGDELNTAIGCIPIKDQNALFGFFLKWAIGIGGGVAILMVVVAGFQIITSQGDPGKLNAGKQLLTSAIAGLLFLVFSVIILRIIGIDILKITF